MTLLRFSHQTCVIDAPALVVFPWVGPGPSGMHMAQHELGHVLGLDHDPDNKDSIMYPTVHEPLLQGNDRRRLRDTYGVDPLAVP